MLTDKMVPRALLWENCTWYPQKKGDRVQNPAEMHSVPIPKQERPASDDVGRFVVPAGHDPATP